MFLSSLDVSWWFAATIPASGSVYTKSPATCRSGNIVLYKAVRQQEDCAEEQDEETDDEEETDDDDEAHHRDSTSAAAVQQHLLPGIWNLWLDAQARDIFSFLPVIQKQQKPKQGAIQPEPSKEGDEHSDDENHGEAEVSSLLKQNRS
jgi:hypothetical protein